MAQRLIVEGNDAIALADLCKKNRLKPPLGYEQPAKFKEEFVSVGGSDTGALNLLRLSLKETNLNNIGFIIDANNHGPAARWQSIRAILSEQYNPATLLAADTQKGPKIITETDMPTIGIWIMPDNSSAGYLEHFLASLIPISDVLYEHANNIIEDLLLSQFNELTEAKKQKALLYTWLAWKKEPGKPFGLAIKSGYFDHTAPAVQPFLDWFGKIFELST